MTKSKIVKEWAERNGVEYVNCSSKGLRGLLAMNVDQVAGKLIKLGIAYKSIYRTEEPEVEDDSIEITDTISVQVSSYGDCYITVGRWCPKAECFFYYPERLDVRQVAEDIRKAMAES